MISVVVPVYNGEAVIGTCLRALQDQDYRGRMEIIVVDDGSTDRSAAVARQYRARVLTQAHSGPATARNRGARSARGEIILFTDADCEPSRSWVREMLAPFDDRTVTGVQGAYRSRQPELMARFSQIEIEDRYTRMRSFTTIDFIGTYAAAYRKSAFPGFDETFTAASGEDSELSFRLAAQGKKLVFAPRAVVYHRHPSTLGDYLRVKFWRAYWRVPLYRKHASKMASETYTPQALKAQIGLVGLVVLFAAGSLVRDDLLFGAGAAYLLLVVSTLPFAFRAVRKDVAVGAASLAILQLRALVFALGLVEGFIRAPRRAA
ncbi:MAG: glycosyltransferase [Candidatus Aenigmarchaeota archaeon]|nr:glycosyltransferase [Candidatus Aenigmarchaeota archaeon]